MAAVDGRYEARNVDTADSSCSIGSREKLRGTVEDWTNQSEPRRVCLVKSIESSECRGTRASGEVENETKARGGHNRSKRGDSDGLEGSSSHGVPLGIREEQI